MILSKSIKYQDFVIEYIFFQQKEIPFSDHFLNRGRRKIFLAPNGRFGKYLIMLIDFVIDG